MDFLIEILTICQLTGLKNLHYYFFPHVDEHILPCPPILSVFMVCMKKSWPVVGDSFRLEAEKSWPAAVCFSD